MKTLPLLLLIFLTLSVSAQVEVVNADSIRLNNTAGTGNTSIYGKLTLKNIAIGNTNDSVLVIAANGRIKFIPRSTITTTGNYVQNQNSTDQSANFRITGRGQFGNRLGLGSAALNSGIVNFYNTLPVTGGATAYSNLTIAEVNSDVTTSARIYQSVIGTQAASFTLPSLYHFYARQGTIGSGSAVTNQYGFAVDNTLTGATNNYGFRGAIPAGSGRWNVYMDGTASNYFEGKVGIGTNAPAEALDVVGKARVSVAPTNATDVVRLTDLTGTINTNAIQNQTSTSQSASFRVSGTGQVGTLGIGNGPAAHIGVYNRLNLTGSASSYGEYSNNVIQSDVTTAAYGKRIMISTAAAAFTLNNLYYNRVDQGTFGAGSTVTAQTGYYVTSSLVDAVNNYAFRSTIPAGTNRWNLYMDGTANNYLAGNMGIGSTALSQHTLHVGKAVTGGTSAYSVTADGIIQSDVTTVGAYFNTRASTQAASFNLNTLIHYRAVENAIGSGSTVTNQYGFSVDASLTGATNNYGYYGGIAASSNRWNLYMGGTASNYLAGNLGVGTSTPSTKVDIKTNTSGAGAAQLRLDNSGTAGNEVGLEFYTSYSSSGNRTGRIYGVWDGSSYVDSRLTFQSMGSSNTLLNTLSLKEGRVGIGTVTSPTAMLTLPAGQTGAGLSPLKFTNGSSLTTPENGAMEYDGTNLYFTPASATRKTVAYTDDITTAIAAIKVNTVSAASTLSVTANGHYTFNGTTTTWTLPTVSGNTGKEYDIYNFGSGNITLNANAGGSDIWVAGTSSATITIAPGDTKTVYNNSIKWIVK